MKRVGYIYEKLISIDNCKLAILEAAKGKRRRKIVRDAINNIDFYAQDLSNRLKSLNFTTPYKSKIIKDGLSGKEREILIPAWYPNQCAHHAIVQILSPIIMKSSYYWSCANIPKRGLDKASKGIERGTIRHQKKSTYCMKCDIRKFYPSVDHDILKQVLRRKIKDCKFLKIMDVIIDSCKIGLPIGNYTSPWLAELLLQFIDYKIISHSATHRYVRYADDITVLGSNKRKLHYLLSDLHHWVSLIGLKLKSNYQVFRVQKNYIGRRIDFVGKCFGLGFTTIRKRRSLAFIRQSRTIQKLQSDNKQITFKMASGFISRSACLKHTNSYKLKITYYDPINIDQLKEIIRHHGLKKDTRNATG